MTGPNGHAQDKGASTSVVPPISAPMAAPAQFSPEKVKALVAELEVPFDLAQIEWRVSVAEILQFDRDSHPIRNSTQERRADSVCVLPVRFDPGSR